MGFTMTTTDDDFGEAEQARREGAGKPVATGNRSWGFLDHIRPVVDLEDGPNWLTAQPPPRDYLLRYLGEVDDNGRPKGVLAAGRVGFLVSPGGVGKSHSLCSLALAVAIAGRSQQTCWLGALEVQKGGRVLMLMGEEELPEIRRRLYGAAQTMELNAADVRRAVDNIVPLALAGEDGVALTQAAVPGSTETETPFSQALRAKLETSGDWCLVIVDPLARFAGDDVEKDNAAATRLVQILEKLSHLPGLPTVLCAHHTRKQATGQTAGTVQSDDMRGASGLRDGARFVAVLEERERVHGAPQMVGFAVRKNNYGIRPSFDLVRLDDGGLRQATEAEQKEYDEAKQAVDVDKKAAALTVKDVAKEKAKGRKPDVVAPVVDLGDDD